jgi:hypothetical protein
MVVDSRARNTDQYIFDAHAGHIVGMPDFATIYKRASIVAMAGSIANAETVGIIEDLIRSAPCRRVRQAATGAAFNMACVDSLQKIKLIEIAMNDKEEIVRSTAGEHLANLSG